MTGSASEAPVLARVTVEVWSDVVCPWCYIGKRRFESALANFAHRDDVEVLFRSFELDPTAAPGTGANLEQLLADKYGMTRERAAEMNARVTQLAAAEGLEYHLDLAKPANTFDAHRLLHLAAANGVGDAAWERFLRGYFTEGIPVGDPDALLHLAVDVGLDAAEAREVLEGDAYSEAVRADEAGAGRLGIRGVPFFVLNRSLGVSGAQPPEVLVQALERAWAEPM